MQSILSIHPDASVEKAVQKIALQGTDAILIKQKEEYTGIFTKTDLIKLLEKNIDAAEVNVSTFMSKPIPTLDANTSVKEARQKMVEINIWQLLFSMLGSLSINPFRY